MNRIVKNKVNIFDNLFCLFLLILPYQTQLPNCFVIILLFIFVYQYGKQKKVEFTKLNKIHYILILALIFYLFIRGIFTNTLYENKHTLSLIIIFLPILFHNIVNKKKIIITIILSVFILIINASYNLFQYYLINKNLNFFEGETINNLINMERPYLGFLCVIAVILLFWLTTQNKKFKVIFYLLIAFIILFLSIISARISLISIFICLILFLLFYIEATFFQKIKGVLLLIIPLVFLVFFNKNLRERLFISNNIEVSIKKFKRHEPRFIIWNCSYLIANEKDFNPIFGLYSEKEIESKYDYYYKKTMTNKNRSNFFINSKLNSHNQFIGTYLTSGVIGLVLLISSLLSQTIIYRKNFFKTALTISLTLFFVFEMVLKREIGVYSYTIVLSLVTVFPLSMNKNNN